MSISILSNTQFANIQPLNQAYTTPESKAKTVTVLGSSRTTDAIAEYMHLCSRATKGLVDNGYNILTGCNLKGIMGAAYKSAQDNSIKDANGKLLQNLAIVVEPAWGDEDLEHCITIGKATSEADRIDKFVRASDSFIIFPGGETTLQETTSLITKNKYPKAGESHKKIILVGEQLFAGLIEQYRTFCKLGTITTPFEKLFKVFNSEADILKEFPRIK